MLVKRLRGGRLSGNLRLPTRWDKAELVWKIWRNGVALSTVTVNKKGNWKWKKYRNIWSNINTKSQKVWRFFLIKYLIESLYQELLKPPRSEMFFPFSQTRCCLVIQMRFVIVFQLKFICLALYKILMEQAFRVTWSDLALNENMNRICCLINTALKDFSQKFTLENIFWIKVSTEAPVPVHSSSVFSFAGFLIDLELPPLR